MPQNQETAATLIARAIQRYEIPALPQTIQNQLALVCAHNDTDPAKVTPAEVVVVLVSRGYDVDPEKLDRICVRDLGRVSFATA